MLPTPGVSRAALSPLIAADPARSLHDLRDQLRKTDEHGFIRFLQENGLAALWYETLKKCNQTALFSPAGMDELHRFSLAAAAAYLRQQHALHGITGIFEAAGIAHAVFKGAHVRELVYANPAVRTACDIDILIARGDRGKAIRVLTAAGFSFHPDAANISHEGHLTDGSVSLDLHWDILRPGRTRVDMTDVFLAKREKFPNHWGLNSEAMLFVMLVHPVFTKYSTTPQAALVRLVDLVRWVQSQRIDWDAVAVLLEQAGVKTAAWITAAWLAMRTGIALPQSFIARIKPGRARAWYLRQWLKQDLPTRLLNHPVLIQAGFTLPAHDTLADAWRAIRQAQREKKMAAANIRRLRNEIAEPREP
jgi:hypothetical protein